MKSNQFSFLRSLFSLAFVLFIDALGMALIFPLINPIFMNPQEAILPHSATIQMRHFYYGVALTLYPLGIFFAAPLLGDLSDTLGRKKILTVSLLGSCLGSLLCAIAVSLNSIFLFFTGRIVGGMTAGSQPIAQAAIIDISHPEKKTHNLSIIIGAMALGWVVGPLMGGFLSDSQIVKWFNPSIALYASAILSFINYVFLHFSFTETIKKQKKFTNLPIHKGPIEFALAFKIKNLRILSPVYLIMQAGWGFFFGYIPLYFNNRFQFTTSSIGLFLGCMALGFMLPAFGLIKPVTKYFIIDHAAAFCSGVSGIFFLLLPLISPFYFFLLFIGILIGFVLGGAFSLYLTLFSNRTHIEEQGRIMGVTSALASVGWVISSFLGAFLANFGDQWPIIIGGSLLIICGLITYFSSSKI